MSIKNSSLTKVENYFLNNLKNNLGCICMITFPYNVSAGMFYFKKLINLIFV